MNGELRALWLQQYYSYSHCFLSSVCVLYVKSPNFFIPLPFLCSVCGYKHVALLEVIYNHVSAQMMYTYN